MRTLLLILLVVLTACGTESEPEAIDRAWVVGGAWVVVLKDERTCWQDDLYRVPDMDEPREAIRACKERLGSSA